MLNQSPPGIAFRNVNIWIGTSGFATPQNIKSATINFKIDKEWLEKNNIAASSIKLMRYSNMWNDLPTQQMESTEKEVHFQAETEGFTFFAITGEKRATSPPAEIDGGEVPRAGETLEQTAEKKPSEEAPAFEVFFAGICLLLVYFVRKKRALR